MKPTLAMCVLVLIGCGADKTIDSDEVWRDPARYDGQQIAIRGWTRITIAGTLLGCVPARCDCNSTSGAFALSEEPEADVFMEAPEVEGGGNECTQRWSPFAPTAPAYELAGRLRVTSQGDDTRLVLEELDLDASRELHGSGDLALLTPSPIETGTLDCHCAQSEWITHCSTELVCNP